MSSPGYSSVQNLLKLKQSVIFELIFFTVFVNLLACCRYYYLSTYICGFAAMAYFSMLSGQGWTAIAGCRQFFYAR
jgi:bacteriorhodopsin